MQSGQNDQHLPGSLRLPLFLAPMEDITDSPFRVLCREMGADAVVTEFISSEGLIRNAAKTMQKLHFVHAERPIGIQIYGNQEESMAKAAKIVEQAEPDFLDINAGCPVKKIVNNGNGAALLKDLALFQQIVRAVRASISIPLTVKLRLGWDKDSINILETVRMLEQEGVNAIFIHGRTRDQAYRGKADWDWIQKAAECVSIPVIGNGDLRNAQDIVQYHKQIPGLAGCMIGRAAVGAPWIFQQIQTQMRDSKASAQQDLDLPDLLDRLDILKRHIALNVDQRGETLGILTMRKHFSGYLKGAPMAAKIRARLMKETTPAGTLQVLDVFSDWYQEFCLIDCQDCEGKEYKKLSLAKSLNLA